MRPPENIPFDRFVDWYREHVRPIVTQLDLARAEEWDIEIDRLVGDVAKPLPETTVCFLGSSGVGKSTLINALAGGTEAILPAGGVGPLTAQALEVRYAGHPRFIAHYHPPSQLNRLVFGIQQAFSAELREHFGGALTPVIDLELPDRADVQDELDAGNTSGLSRRDEYRKQARLLVTGNQEGESDLPYLLGALRAVIDAGDTDLGQFRAEDRDRIERLRRAADAGRKDQPFVVDETASIADFRKELKDHAAGFLAPLIRKLKVEYPADFLNGGASLVDLPGVGVAGDVYRRVTTEWVRAKARVIVLVVDRSGITDAAADLLRSSGFFNRLLYASVSPDEDPVSLLIAVTRVDDVAAEMRRNDRSRSRLDYFRLLRDDLERQMRRQLGEQLATVQRQGDASLSANERQLIDRIVNEVEIHPLSAIEYRKLLIDDVEDQPFIRAARETGVPGLQDTLRNLAMRRRSAWREAIHNRQVQFVSRVMKTLWAMIPAAEELAAELAEEVARLRASFREFIAAKRREYDVRRGQFREFWKVTLHHLIAAQVAEARRAATQRMQAYLMTMAGAHAATLKAAVNRGGTFHGARRIDLANDLALCFDGAIAERWGSPILQLIRERTQEFACDYVTLVEEVVDWARSHNCPQVSDRLLAQVEALRADALRAAEAGRDLTAEIRDLVNQRLVRSIEEPIRDRCKEFREKNLNEGRGVKDRILKLFSDLGEEVGNVASQQALPMLAAAVRDTEDAIQEHSVFKRNPLDTVDQLAAELVSDTSPEARRRIEQGRAVASALSFLN
jgi:energy-coupling factor transporter ATP-binding protein EcfA2